MVKVSFDADGTLIHQKSIQEYAKELIAKGYDVHVVTRRYDSADKYTKEFNTKYGITDIQMEHNQLFEVADEVGIPRDKIHFCNMTDKFLYFEQHPEFLWHLDDDHFELNDINEFTKVIGISCSGQSTWKAKCDKLIEVYKFNNKK